MANSFSDREALTGLMAAFLGLTTLLEQRGVLDREELARLLDGMAQPGKNPDLQLPEGMRAYLETLAVGIRNKNFDNLPPPIQMIRFP